MNKEMNKRLVSVAYDVIEEEKLPRPKEVRLRLSLYGTRSRRGTCIKFAEGYRIIIHTSEAKFIECENGPLVDRKTKKTYRRAIGEELPFERLVEILAHEIAHLKFWKHDTQHKSYTRNILGKLKQRLGQIVT